jgi:hypothetical protein
MVHKSVIGVSIIFIFDYIIRNIVSGTSGSAPYIIFGPPGTGASPTLVYFLYNFGRWVF